MNRFNKGTAFICMVNSVEKECKKHWKGREREIKKKTKKTPKATKTTFTTTIQKFKAQDETVFTEDSDS